MAYPQLRRALVPVILVLATVGVGAPVACLAQTRFLIGEDIVGPDGLVVSLNSFSRESFTGGLGSQKEDVFEVHLTIVNTGKQPVSFDPTSDFRLRFPTMNDFEPQAIPGRNGLVREFSVNPNTQTRAALAFKILTEAAGAPDLVVNKGGGLLLISCSRELQKAYEQSLIGTIDIEEGIPLVRFFLLGERLGNADKVLRQLLGKFGQDPRLLILQAQISRETGEPDRARQLLADIGSSGNLADEDARTLGRQAFELGDYRSAKSLLEPLLRAGKSEELDAMFVARCLYIERNFGQAETILLQLADNGMEHRLLFFTLGNIAEKRSDWEAAINWWKRALEVDGMYAEAQFNIGVAEYQRREIDRAEAAWRRVLLMNPDQETKEAVADALNSLGR